MLSLGHTQRVFAARRPVDFRLGFDGLCAIARDVLGRDPLGGHAFVFFNRRRDRTKILVFDRNGFWLHYKRLERGTFEVLEHVDGDVADIEIDERKLRLLLDGIDLKNVKFRRHFKHALRIGERATVRS
jgi:hypothetical protein